MSCIRLLSAVPILFFLSISAYSQCLEEGIVLLPEKVISKSNNYGSEMASYGDYLLVSASLNDSLEYDGGLVYLYKLVSGNWERIAELTSSEYNFQMFFGRKIAIGNNIIVVAGNTISSEGFHYDELFVFTKNDDQEWSNATESYRINLRDDLEGPGLITNKLVINNGYLGVSYYIANESVVAFYEILTDLTLSHLKTIVGSKDENDNRGEFGVDFDFSNSTVAVGAPTFSSGNGSVRGMVYVYDWNDILTDENPLPKGELVPTNTSQQDYGRQIEVENNTVYAANGYRFTEDAEYPTEIYVFEKPPGGWINSNESAVLTTGTSDYFGYRHTLKVSGDYVLLSRDFRENKLYGFKKEGIWTDSTPTFAITKEFEDDRDERLFARDFCIFDDHLVTAYVDGISRFYPDRQDKLLSYYVPGGLYENITDLHQEITELSYSASDANFGTSISYSNNKLAIGAIGDKVAGEYGGAVYIYRRDPVTEEYKNSDLIRPPDGKPYDNFGYSVELKDTLLFVSSLFYDSLNDDGSYFNGSIGKVYQYALKEGVWELRNTVYSPDDLSDEDNKHFGRSISYSDNNLAISQYYSGSSESNGKVHIFQMNEDDRWIPVAEMKTEDQQGGDFFGRKIVLRDSLLVVGTGNPEFGISDEMRVYLFKKKDNEWVSGTEDAYLLPSDKHRFDRFGFSFDLHRDLVVVGAPGYNYGDTKDFSGKAYVFRQPKDGWSGKIEESLILEPKEPLEEDFFGYDVFIDDNQILVGAASSINNPSSIWYTSDIGDLQPGKLYFFDPFSEMDDKISSRNEQYIQLSPNNRYLDAFGYALEKSYDRVFVSAIYDNNESGYRSGGVYDLKFTTYIYSLETPVCYENGPFQLQSNILGGVWAGEGIIDSENGWFDPSLVEQDGWTIVTYTAGDCTVSSSFYVVSPPQVLTQSDSSILKCKNDDSTLYVSYSSKSRTTTSWYFKDNLSASWREIRSDTDSINIDDPGLYKVEISNGYCNPLIREFEVNDESIDAKLNHDSFVEICSYLSESLYLVTSDDIRSVTWFYKESGGTSFSMIEESDQIKPKESGFYFARYKTELCSHDSDSVEVFYNNVDFTTTEPDVICSNEPYQLEIIPHGGKWSGVGVDNNGLINPNELENGKYSATYTLVDGGCLFSTELDFEVELLPIPKVAYENTDVCKGRPVELSVENNINNAQISWFDVYNEIIVQSNTLVTDQPGSYIVGLFENNCISYQIR
ncbi:MAG: FG-GAP repeat protein [Bacteroidota bacterium]